MNAGSTTGNNSCASETEAWDKAYRRTVAFLRAYQFHDALHRNLRAQEIVAVAKETIPADTCPEVFTIQLARERVTKWEQTIHNQLRLEGRSLKEWELLTILEIAQIPKRWPMYFLQPPPYPNALLDALYDAETVRVPAFQSQQFGQPQLSFPLTSSFLNTTGSWLRKWSIVRILLGWLVAGAIVGIILLLIR